MHLSINLRVCDCLVVCLFQFSIVGTINLRKRLNFLGCYGSDLVGKIKAVFGKNKLAYKLVRVWMDHKLDYKLLGVAFWELFVVFSNYTHININ